MTASRREKIQSMPLNNVFTVAPGEGQKPVGILSDQHFEEMCNPTKYPTEDMDSSQRNPGLQCASRDCLVLMEDCKGH